MKNFVSNLYNLYKVPSFLSDQLTQALNNSDVVLFWDCSIGGHGIRPYSVGRGERSLKREIFGLLQIGKRE